MKRVLFFCFAVAMFWSCNVDDDSREHFHYEVLPVESAIVPEEVMHGETYIIKYSYLRPSTCHLFHDLYYVAEGSSRTVAVISADYNSAKNVTCNTLSNEMVERSFNFVVLKEEGIYEFKFWTGKDENEKDTYLIFEIPVVK